MILLLQHCRSINVKKTKRGKVQKEPPKKSAPATRDGLLFCKSYSDVVHGLCSPNKGRSNRPKRSSRHLKMVSRVIRLGELLRTPTDNGDFNGTADDNNIVRRNNLFPTTSIHHNHHRGRMTTLATTQFPMTRGSNRRRPNDKNNNDMTITAMQQQAQQPQTRYRKGAAEFIYQHHQKPQSNAKALPVGERNTATNI